MQNFIKPTAALLVVTLIAAFALGMVYDITLKPIAEQKAKNEAESIQQLLPGTDKTLSQEVSLDDSTVTQAIACYGTDGAVLGYALLASPKGYGGAVDIMVAFDTTGVIKGMTIISHSETPGLGADAALPEFTDQYTGKSGHLRVVKQKPLAADEVEAVTSATITSNAVTTGVNDATDYFETYIRTASRP